MKAIILRCKPNSQFHFGEVGQEDVSLNRTSEIPHSDTIFSALVNIYASLFDDTDMFILNFEEGNIRISSGCFCLEKIKENKSATHLFFLPKPVFLNTEEAKSTEFKKLKKIKYLSKSLWETGVNMNDLLSEKVALVSNGEFAVTNTKINNIDAESDRFGLKQPDCTLYTFEERPRVKVYTNEISGNFYTETNTTISRIKRDKSAVHYYFLLDDSGLDNDMKAKLATVLELLPDVGLGGERSVGCGRFEGISIKENFTFNIADPWQASAKASFSLIFPKTSNEVKQMKYYQTKWRGGRNLGKSSDQENNRLKIINMMLEGALCNPEVKGEIKDISPEGNSSYLRYGKAFLLPIHKNWNPE